MESRVAKLETHIEHINFTLSSIDARLLSMDTRHSDKIDSLSEKVSTINLRLAWSAGALFAGVLVAGWFLSGKLDAVIEIARAAQ